MDHGILSDIELPISSVNLNQINNNSFNLTQGYHPLTTSAGLNAVGVAQQQPQQQQQQQQQQHSSSILGGPDHYGNPMALGGNNNNNTLLSAAGSLVDNSCLFSTGSTTIDYGGSPLQELPDTKEGIEELCPVCGDKVSGYHYGLLTCESCKGFFKRTVQNKKVYTCVADRSCQIDKAQRKRCPFCRFQKCLEVGMKLEAVRADRMRGGRNKFGPMYKRDRARKMQIMRQRTLPSSPRGLSIVGNEAVTVSYPNLNTTHSVSYGSGNVTIKQEIQYPVLSSTSTSSPDSSPSPINPPVTSMAAVSPHLNGTLQAQGGLVSPDPNLWSSSPGTPSPPSSRISPLLTNGGSPGTVGGTGVMTTPTGMTKIPLLIREFVQTLDDREWQNALFGLLQNQTYNQCEVDLFELMCKVLDQNLFAQVDWARNSIFFKDLKVDDQMKLLQQSWSDMLILDHVHHRLHNNLPDDTTLPNGQKFSLLSLALLGMTQHVQDFNDITAKLQELKFDLSDFVCLKFILLLNPDVKTLVNRKHVQTAHDQVQQAMLEYCVNVYPQMPDKYSRLMALMPEIHSLSARGEEYLYYKHVNGNAPTQTLLMEMLHAKKKQ